MLRLWKIILAIITVFSLGECDRIRRQGFLDLTQLARCRTPLGEVGVCVSIKQCPPLMDLLRYQSHKAEVVNYLRASVCRYEDSTPVVCCSELSNPSALGLDKTTKPPRQTTPRPQTTTPSKNYEDVSNPTLPKPGECGVSDLHNVRVVGGQNATLGAWPWIVALGYRSSKNPEKPAYLCGGSLITNRHILTAAHCVYNRKNLYTARLGELNLYDDNDGADPIDVPIAEKIIHKGYTPTSFVNDIAVLKLAYPVKFTNLLKPICLPLTPDWKTFNYVNRRPFIAGWGSLYFNGPSSDVLQQLQIPVVSERDCKRSFASFKTAVIDERVLCAGFLRGGRDACKGDSGGPLMDSKTVNKNGIYYQIGVVSYGYKCAEPNFPGVYTKVAAFSDWILESLKV